MMNPVLIPRLSHHDSLTEWDWGKKFQIKRWSSEIVDINPQTKFHIRLGIKEANKRRKVQLVITRGKRGGHEFCYEFQPKLDRRFKCGGLKVARNTELIVALCSNSKDIIFEVRFGECLYRSTPQTLSQLEEFLAPKKLERAFYAIVQ